MSGAEFARYARDLALAAAGIDTMAGAAVERVARGALKAAESIAPVDSGALVQSLTMRREGERAVVSTSAYYAMFQEFGTSRMAPNPFIGPAFQRWAPELVNEVTLIRDTVVKRLS